MAAPAWLWLCRGERPLSVGQDNSPSSALPPALCPWIFCGAGFITASWPPRGSSCHCCSLPGGTNEQLGCRTQTAPQGFQAWAASLHVGQEPVPCMLLLSSISHVGFRAAEEGLRCLPTSVCLFVLAAGRGGLPGAAFAGSLTPSIPGRLLPPASMDFKAWCSYFPVLWVFPLKGEQPRAVRVSSCDCDLLAERSRAAATWTLPCPCSQPAAASHGPGRGCSAAHRHLQGAAGQGGTRGGRTARGEGKPHARLSPHPWHPGGSRGGF